MRRAKLLSGPALLAAGALSIHLALPSVAHAEPPMSADASAADAHFDRGTEFAEKNMAPEAEEEFEKAWALRKAWDIAGNLGLVEAAQGKWEEAAEHLHYALKYIGSLATPEQRQGLQERYDNVRGRLALVNVKTNVAATVKVGPRTVASADPLFLSEGAHTLEVSADGHEKQTVELRVAKGETKDLPIALKKVAGSGPPPGGGEGAPAWLGWVLGGSGLAAAGVGAALLGLGQAKLGEAGDLGDELGPEVDCASPSAADASRCEDGVKLVDDASTFTIAGGVLVGVGAAALLGAILVWTIPGESAGSTAAKMQFVPWSDGQSGGLVMRGVY
jgi:tetratricopeptide (TPR) repeat protein